MAGVVVTGGLLGLGLGWAFWGQREQPADIVIDLLEERCAPYVADGTAPVSGLAQISIGAKTGFVESQKNITVTFMKRGGHRRCSVIDLFDQWSDEESNRVLHAVRDFAFDSVAPANNGLLIEEDVTSAGVGDPQITWRRPDMEVGHYVGFTRFHFPQGGAKTMVTFGSGKFVRPAQNVRGFDA